MIFGDIQNIEGISDAWIKLSSEVVKNPDCWFVYQHEKHGYKDLDNENFTFSEALDLIKKGYKLTRNGWDGDNTRLQLIKPVNVVDADSKYIKDYPVHECIGLKTAEDIWSIYSMDQFDVLSEDWIVLK